MKTGKPPEYANQAPAWKRRDIVRASIGLLSMGSAAPWLSACGGGNAAVAPEALAGSQVLTGSTEMAKLSGLPPFVEVTATPRSKTPPSPEVVAKVNEIRAAKKLPPAEELGLQIREISEVELYGKRSGPAWRVALEIMSDSYSEHPGATVSQRLQYQDEDKAKRYRRNIATNSGDDARREFVIVAKARIYTICGTTTNALYSWSSSIDKESHFHLSGLDMQYIFNGPPSGQPGDGMVRLNNDYNRLMALDEIKFDYCNLLLSLSRYRSSEALDFDRLWSTLTSKEYAEYFNEVMRLGPAYKELALQKLSEEMFSLDVYGDKDKHSDVLLSMLQLRFNADSIFKRFNGVETVDYAHELTEDVVADVSYLMNKVHAGLARSTNSVLKNALADAAAIFEVFNTVPQEVAGSNTRAAVISISMSLSGHEAGTGFVEDSAVEAIVKAQSAKFKIATTRTQQLFDVFKKLNASGLQSTVGGCLALYSAILTSIHLSQKDGPLTVDERLSLASAYLSVVSPIGAYRNLGKTVVSNIARCMGWATNLSELWGANGSMLANMPERARPPTANQVAVMQAAADAVNDGLARERISGPELNDTARQRLAAERVNQLFRRQLSAEGVQEIELVSFDRQISREPVVQQAIESVSGIPKGHRFSINFAKAIGIAGTVAALGADAINIYISSKNISENKQVAANSLQLLSDVSDVVGCVSSLGQLVTVSVGRQAITATLGVVGLVANAVMAVFWFAAAIQRSADLNAAVRAERDAFRQLMQQFEEKGYISNWGAKIQFLATYYSLLQEFLYCHVGGTRKDVPNRVGPQDMAIFSTEYDAWKAFYQFPHDAAGNKFDGCREKLKLPGVACSVQDDLIKTKKWACGQQT